MVAARHTLGLVLRKIGAHVNIRFKIRKEIWMLQQFAAQRPDSSLHFPKPLEEPPDNFRMWFVGNKLAVGGVDNGFPLNEKVFLPVNKIPNGYGSACPLAAFEDAVSCAM